MIETRADRARVGLSLVVGTAVIIAATTWLLPAHAADKQAACVVVTLMAATAAGWRLATVGLRHPLTFLAYPLIVFGGLAAVGDVTTGLATAYGGFFTLSFIYAGLYLPPRATAVLMPPAMVSWLISNGALSGAPLQALEVRLPIATIIWGLVGGLLSQHAQATTRSAATLRREAQRDALTGLRNRRVLEDVLTAAQPGDVVVLLDLDHFKAVNDQRGHGAGDELLVGFARTLVRSIRDQDLAIRFGGDEFLLYLPQSTIDAAETVLQRLRAAWQRQDAEATFSAGIATVRIGRDGTDAFGEADRFLYDAKAAGRDQWARPAPPQLPAARASREATAPAPAWLGGGR